MPGAHPGIYRHLRRYPEAIEADPHALTLVPDLIHRRLSLGWNFFNWKGELDTLRALLQSLPVTGGAGVGPRLLLLLWERRPDSLFAPPRRPPGDRHDPGGLPYCV